MLRFALLPRITMNPSGVDAILRNSGCIRIAFAVCIRVRRSRMARRFQWRVIHGYLDGDSQRGNIFQDLAGTNPGCGYNVSCFLHGNNGAMAEAHSTRMSIIKVLRDMEREARRTGWARTKSGWVSSGRKIHAQSQVPDILLKWLVVSGASGSRAKSSAFCETQGYTRKTATTATPGTAAPAL